MAEHREPEEPEVSVKTRKRDEGLRRTAALISEAVLEKNVIELAERLGWMVYSVRRSVRAIVNSHTGKGFPDLVLVRWSLVLFRELKSSRGRLTPEQKMWQAHLVKAQQDVGIWRPADWLDGTIERQLRMVSDFRDQVFPTGSNTRRRGR